MNSSVSITIRELSAQDHTAVLAIYGEGLATGHATFQDQVPDWSGWDAGYHAHCRLVAEKSGCVVGWAALAPVSGRAVYSGVAEVSLYVGATFRGEGIGGALLGALVEAAEDQGFWMLQAGVFPENEASVRLHKAHGFREVGVRKGLGRMRHGPFAGCWRDVLLLERRSTVVGCA